MKRIKFIDGIMDMVEKLSSITALIMDRVTGKRSGQISSAQEKGLEEVIKGISGQLEELEKEIQAMSGVNKEVSDNVTYLDQIEATEVPPAQVKDKVVGQEQVVEYPIKKQAEYIRDTNKVIYIDTIPSVVKISKKHHVIHKKVNGTPIEQTYQVENKGSIHPLHRFLKVILKRGNVHQREPTWTQWKEL